MRAESRFRIEVELLTTEPIATEKIAGAISASSACVNVTLNVASSYARALKNTLHGNTSTVARYGTAGKQFKLLSPFIENGSNEFKDGCDLLKEIDGMDRVRFSKEKGLHVHIDAHRLTFEGLKKICRTFVRYEDTIDTFLPPSRRTGSKASDKFFRSNKAALYGTKIRTDGECGDAILACTTLKELIDLVNPLDRYYKLNLRNVTNENQPTIEFCQHSTTTNGVKIHAWVELCTAIVNHSVFSSALDLCGQTGEFRDLFENVVKNEDLRSFFEKRRKSFLVPIARPMGSEEEKKLHTVLEDETESLSSTRENVEESETLSDSGAIQPQPGANSLFPELHGDNIYYTQNKGTVDDFINAVCAKKSFNYLGNLISKVDTAMKKLDGDLDLSMTEPSDLVNRPSFKHNIEEGRTPLAYAVDMNLTAQIYDLLKLGANVSKVMTNPDITGKGKPGLPITVLVIAATNARRDGTDMLRILLSKGAKPSELEDAGVVEKNLSRGMRYWINKARCTGTPSRDMLKHLALLPPMDRLHELNYAVVGEEAAISTVQQDLASRFGNAQGNKSPLVMLLLGPPGHGKTFFSANMARSLIGEDNFLFIACQSIRDDADLFGSRLGGSQKEDWSSDGQITSWLRTRQGKNTVIFLDEFEKIKGLTSALGWKQDKKIYQSFLEPWQDGTISDQGKNSGNIGSGRDTGVGGNKIDCSQTIWILTSNWGQEEIVDFSIKHKSRVYEQIEEDDVAWLQKNLVKKILNPLVMKELGGINKELKALCRRIDRIVPFMPFTKKEQKVVADIALREKFSLYREPCVTKGQENCRRLFGNLVLKHTRAFGDHAAESYDPMYGASSMLSMASQADGLFLLKIVNGSFKLSEEEKILIQNAQPPSHYHQRPVFWLHHDKDTDMIHFSQNNPEVDTYDDLFDDERDNFTAESKLQPDSSTHSDFEDLALVSKENDGTEPANNYSSTADDVF